MFIAANATQIVDAIKKGASIPKPPTINPAPKSSEPKAKQPDFDQWIKSGGLNRPETRTDNAFGAETLPVIPKLGLPKLPKQPKAHNGWPFDQLPSIIAPKPVPHPKDRLL